MNVPIRSHNKRKAQVKYRAFHLDFHRLQLQAGEFQLWQWRILKNHHYLKHRIAAEIALWLQQFDQLPERNILVRIGGQRDLADPGDKLAETGIAAEAGAQHQLVYEQANQPFSANLVAVGNVCSNNNIFLSSIAAEQRLKSGKQCHIERDAFTAAQFPEFVA